MESSLQNKHVAIYARFSSDLQNESSAEDQVRRCEEYLRRVGGEVRQDLVFMDKAVSGASMDRPAFNELRARIKRGEIEVVLTENLDRISRKVRDSAEFLDDLKYRDVQLLTVSDGGDSRHKSAKMNYTLRAMMAEM